jgi:hypothetical protein
VEWIHLASSVLNIPLRTRINNVLRQNSSLMRDQVLPENLSYTKKCVDTILSLRVSSTKNFRLSMTVQPFVAPWPLFQFLIPMHSR